MGKIQDFKTQDPTEDSFAPGIGLVREWWLGIM
jgi:hypothetical protein